MNKKKYFGHLEYTIQKDIRHHLVEWTATFFSVVGAVLNAQLNIWGFYLFIAGNVFWTAFAIKHKHWGLLLTQILFFVLNIYGIYVWMGKGIV